MPGRLGVDFVKAKFQELEARKGELEEFLSATEEAPVFVHPNMAHRYAESISELMTMFNEPEHRPEAAKTIRTLVDEIVLTPNEDASELVADMKGDLAAILSLADCRKKSAGLRTADQMDSNERKE